MTLQDHAKLKKLTDLIFNANNWLHDEAGVGDFDPESEVLRSLARDLALRIMKELSL